MVFDRSPMELSGRHDWSTMKPYFEPCLLRKMFERVLPNENGFETICITVSVIKIVVDIKVFTSF